MVKREHKPKTSQTKKNQKLPDVYKASAKEFQELLKKACQPITEKKPKKKPDSRQSGTQGFRLYDDCNGKHTH